MRNFLKDIVLSSPQDVEAVQRKLNGEASKGKKIKEIKGSKIIMEDVEEEAFKYRIYPLSKEKPIYQGEEITKEVLAELNEAKGWEVVGGNTWAIVFSADSKNGQEPISLDIDGVDKIKRKVAWNESLVFFSVVMMILVNIMLIKPISFSVIDYRFNLFIVSGTMILMGLILSLFGFMRAVLFLMTGKSRGYNQFYGLYRGVIIAAGILVGLLIIEGLIKLGFMLKIIMILSIALIVCGMTLLIKYRRKHKTMTWKNIVFIVLSMGVLWVILCGILIGGISNAVSRRDMLEKPHEDMEYIFTLKDFGVEEKPHFASVDRSDSIIVPEYYRYRESSRKGSVESEYVRFISAWAAKKYIQEYVEEEIEDISFEDTFIESDDGEFYHRILKDFKTVHIYRKGKEVFIFNTNLGEKEEESIRIVEEFMNEKNQLEKSRCQ